MDCSYNYAGRGVILDQHGNAIGLADLNKRGASCGVEWVEELCAQHRQIVDNPHRPLLIALPEGDYAVCGLYVESIFSALTDMFGDSVSWNSTLPGIVIQRPQWPDDALSLFESLGLDVCEIAARRMGMVSSHARELHEQAMDAVRQGYIIPGERLGSTATLFDHQKDSALVLAARGGGMIADDVGSGKTAMFLNGFFIRALYRMDVLGESPRDVFPLVVVTKKALVDNTVKEARMWAPNLTTHVVNSPRSMPIPPDAHIIVVSLPTLVKTVFEFSQLNIQGLIVDESHMVKNVAAQRTQATMRLAEVVKQSPMPYIVCASATPMPNRPSELWAQLTIAGLDQPIVEHVSTMQAFPARVKTKFSSRYTAPVDDQKKFEIRYCRGKAGRFGWDATGSSNEEELAQLLRNNGLIRRTKKEFMHPLPRLSVRTLECRLSESDERTYMQAEEEFASFMVAHVRAQSEKERWSAHTMMKEISSTLGKVERAEAIMRMTALRRMIGEMKIPSIMAWIESFFADSRPHHNRLIVFAHHKSVIAALTEECEKRWETRSITVSTKKVDDVVSWFQDDSPNNRVVVCYSGAREGITLTASHHVVVTELPFTGADVIQMAGRCWARLSRDYPPHAATIHLACAPVGIDTSLYDMMEHKLWLGKTIVDACDMYEPDDDVDDKAALMELGSRLASERR